MRPEAEQLVEVAAATDATVLERHSRSPHASVRKAVLTHAATPATTAKELILGDVDKCVQAHGAQWAGATKAVLKELAEDDQQPQDVRVAAISNQRIPRAVLERLTGHADPVIASEAGKALESRP
ncbi:hypothetical protein [Kocuria rosea]|uniref:hypothetical protein n=1 Tax=Kocuria rosea TaxID=1275 RepID=UPI0011A267BF|nr:hypothetical protein [Kocuria rosea]